MQATYITAKGAQVVLTLTGSSIMVAVNGKELGKMKMIQNHPVQSTVIRIQGMDAMVGVPAAAEASVRAIEQAARAAFNAEFLATEEGKAALQMGAVERAMALHAYHDSEA